MHPVIERAAERHAKLDRTMPKVSGIGGGSLTGELSSGHWRTKARERHHPHVATSCKRFGVKPSAGRVADIYTGESGSGQDDGTGYFDEWRAAGGLNQIPKPKTKRQDDLHRLCIAFIAGEDLGEQVKQGMREFIAKIIDTDPKHGNAWRLAMGIAGLYS